jgi:hypothetical protein
MCNRRVTRLTMLLAASALSVAAHGATPIKWIDEHGIVHYGDRASAEAVVRTSATRDTRTSVAVPVAVSAKAGDTPLLTPAEQQRKDRVLLDSYSSASEIDRARERFISSIQAEIDLAQRNVEKLKLRRGELEGTKVASPAKAAAPAGTDAAQVNDLLTQELRFIALKTDQLDKASARYDADKRRWQEINGEVASR